MCDVPGLVRRYLRAASASVFRSSGRCGRGNRAATWESAEQGGEMVGDWIWRVLLCSGGKSILVVGANGFAVAAVVGGFGMLVTRTPPADKK